MGPGEVLVQFDRGNGYWRLTIDDDGRGFPFSGCFSTADLEAEGKGPLVIKECVRLIDGELKLESIAGRGVGSPRDRGRSIPADVRDLDSPFCGPCHTVERRHRTWTMTAAWARALHLTMVCDLHHWRGGYSLVRSQ